MDIQRNQRADHLELSVAGRLDGYWAQHLSTSVAEVMREGTHAVRVNLSATTYISSAGIGVLVELYKNFAAVNGSFRVVEPSKQVRQILELVGLGDMLMGTATAAAPAPVRAPERRESGGAIYEIYELNGAGFECRFFGDPSRLRNGAFQGEEDAHTLALAESRVALGLGAFGGESFGEFLAVAGAGAFQPTDGTNFPDFMLCSGNFVPDLTALYGLCCDGAFSKLVRFESASPSDPVPLSAIVSECLEVAGGKQAALVILSESAGLMGAAIKRAPVAANANLFAYPEVRSWLSFSPERCFGRHLALIAGVAARGEGGTLAPFIRPAGRDSSLSAHFHAAAFGYRPLKKGALDLKTSTRALFEAGGLEGVLHLLADDRESSGPAESELRRGACWVGPIRASRPGERNL